MKKIIFYSFFMLLCMKGVYAQEPSYIEEMESLGAVSGQGLACQASKYDTFELLARAILISKAKSDSMQKEGMNSFNEYKVNAFVSKIKDGFADCQRISEAFDNQKIFKAVLYGDGSIKMPDGKIITPRHAYDATLVYKKDPNAREKFIKLYKDQSDKIHNDPNYQKALRERQLKEGL